MKMSCWPYIDQSRLTVRERHDNRAIFGARKKRERERKGVTFFDMSIYFRPISGIPWRKYPPRSFADCITRRGMRRTEIEKKRNWKCEEETENERKGVTKRKGEAQRQREKERERKTAERRHVGTRHPSAQCLSFAPLSPLKRRETVTYARKYHVYRGSSDSCLWRAGQSIQRTQRSSCDLGDLYYHIVLGYT